MAQRRKLMTIQKYRESHPEMKDVDDWTLTRQLHQQYEPKSDLMDFASRLNVLQGGQADEPFIDPIDAVAGPLGFLRKLGTKATAKAVGYSLASEPVVGGAVEAVDKAMGSMPGWAKAPVDLGVAVLTGVGTERALSKAVGATSKAAAKGATAVTNAAKSDYLKNAFRGRFMTDEAVPVVADVAQEAAAAKALPLPDKPSDMTLHANPLPKAWDMVTGAWEKHVGSPIWDRLIMEKVPEMVEKVPYVGKRVKDAVGKALVYGYRGDLPDASDFNHAVESMKLGQDLGTDYGVDLGKRLSALPEADQLSVGDYLRGAANELPDTLAEIGEEAKGAMYHLGRQAVDAGLLDEAVFFKNVGRYMPRLYTSKEYQGLLSRYALPQPNKLDLSRFKARKDIPEEVRREMGEILAPGYPVAKGIAQMTHDIEAANLFKRIAQNSKWAAADPLSAPEGWKTLEGKRFGALDGMAVHPEVAAEAEWLRAPSGGFERAYRKALGSWKFGKVVLSPKTHIRNVLSNTFLAHLGGMPLPYQPAYLAKAARALSSGNEAWQAAKSAGLLNSSFSQHDLRGLFDDVAARMGGDAPDMPKAVGRVGELTSSMLAAARKAGAKAADLYQAEEDWFKMAMFLHQRDKGASVAEAAQHAEKWLFNYGKLTRFQDKYRTYGAPFATFTFKSVPRVLESAVKTPWRIGGILAAAHYIEGAVNKELGDTPEVAQAKREMAPEWMRGGLPGAPNFFRLPVRDDYGREYYLNLSYIFPWGDVAEATTGDGVFDSMNPLNNPFAKLGYEQLLNKEGFTGRPIVADADLAGKDRADKALTQLVSRGGHLVRGLAPTIVGDIQKGFAAAKNEPDYRGRTRPFGAVAADALVGFKAYPVDYAEQLARKLFKVDPRKGLFARQIMADIRTDAIKADAMRKRGADASYYEESIRRRTQQLIGLAQESEELAKVGAKALQTTPQDVVER